MAVCLCEYRGCCVTCVAKTRPIVLWQGCAPSFAGLMPIVWEWLGALDHTRRRWLDAGEGSRVHREFAASPSSLLLLSSSMLSQKLFSFCLSLPFFIHSFKKNKKKLTSHTRASASLHGVNMKQHFCDCSPYLGMSALKVTFQTWEVWSIFWGGAQTGKIRRKMQCI